MAVLVVACGRVSLGSESLEQDSRGLPGSGGAASSPSGAGTGPESRPPIGGTGERPGGATGGRPGGATGVHLDAGSGAFGGGPVRGWPDAGGASAEAGQGGGAAAPDGGDLLDGAAPVELEPPSCRSESPLCSEEDGLASCCASLPVPGADFILSVDNHRTIPASVAPFRLDRFEVTVGRMRAFSAEYDRWRAAGEPRADLGAHPLIAGSGWQERFDEHLPATAAALEAGLRQCNDAPFSTYSDGMTDRVPVNCVSWFEAAAFCAWDGGRLPTLAELVAAGSGGGENRLYPWGDAPVPRRELALFGCRLDLDVPVCTLDDVSDVGLRPLGAGRFGHDDLAGSMSEWVLDGVPVFGSSCTNCASLDERQRTWRGGSWLDGADGMKNAPFSAMDPSQRTLFLGFRCARDD